MLGPFRLSAASRPCKAPGELGVPSGAGAGPGDSGATPQGLVRARRQCPSVALAAMPHPAGSPGTNPPGTPRSPGCRLLLARPVSPRAPPSPWNPPRDPWAAPPIPQPWMNTPEIPFSGSAAMQGRLLHHHNHNNNNYYYYLKFILEFFVAFPSAGGWLRRWHCATQGSFAEPLGCPSTSSQPSPGVQAQLGLGLFVWALPGFSRSQGSFFPLSRRPPGNGKP